jgi:hypothetical protein
MKDARDSGSLAGLVAMGSKTTHRTRPFAFPGKAFQRKTARSGPSATASLRSGDAVPPTVGRTYAVRSA